MHTFLASEKTCLHLHSEAFPLSLFCQLHCVTQREIELGRRVAIMYIMCIIWKARDNRALCNQVTICGEIKKKEPF